MTRVETPALRTVIRSFRDQAYANFELYRSRGDNRLWQGLVEFIESLSDAAVIAKGRQRCQGAICGQHPIVCQRRLEQLMMIIIGFGAGYYLAGVVGSGYRSDSGRHVEITARLLQRKGRRARIHPAGMQVAQQANGRLRQQQIEPYPIFRQRRRQIRQTGAFRCNEIGGVVVGS
jgi:hypothetical protein